MNREISDHQCAGMPRQVLKWPVRVVCCCALLLFASSWIGANGQIVSSEQQREIGRAPQLLKLAALRIMSRRMGTQPVDLEIVDFERVEYPAQGHSGFIVKVINKRTHVIRTALLDSLGRELKIEQVEADERTAYFKQYGRLDKGLAARLVTARPDDRIEVALWIKTPGYDPHTIREDAITAGGDDEDALRGKAHDQRVAFIQPIISPVVSRLSDLGCDATADALSPLIHATMPARLVVSISRDTHRWPEIERIYHSSPMHPCLIKSRKTIGADIVQARTTDGGVHVRGAKTKVAMLEAADRVTVNNNEIETSRVAARMLVPAWNNPYLTGTAIDSPLRVGERGSPHATAVAGILRAWNPNLSTSFIGIAPRCSLWAGGTAHQSNAEMHASATAALQWHAMTMNMSFGHAADDVDEEARFYDDLVFNQFITAVAAAGNDGFPGMSGQIESPALGYNVIAVGSYNDRSENRSDDAIALSSSYVNPPGRHKPEVYAPGVRIKSTSVAAPWINLKGSSGTSFATPMVTGTTALMMQRARSLVADPEAVKAILIASADRLIKPANRSRNPGRSLAADNADDVARGQNGNWGDVRFSPTDGNTIVLTQMSLAKGKHTRVAISWLIDPNREPNYGTGNPVIEADLMVLDPDGNVIETDARHGDTNRAVDFKPAKEGLYTVQISKQRCEYITHLGWAWWQEPHTVIDVNDAKSGPGQTVKLSATLWFTTDHKLLTNKTLTFHVEGDGTPYSMQTDANGVATVSYTVPDGISGDRQITVDFGGDNDYGSASGTATLALSKGDTFIYVGGSGDLRPGGFVTVTASLFTGPVDAPVMLAGKTLSLGPGFTDSNGNALVANVVTNENGIGSATFPIPADVIPGPYFPGAEFHGDALYNPATILASFMYWINP